MAEEKKTGTKDAKAKRWTLKRVFRVCLWVAGIWLAVIVLAVATSPLWLGPAAKSVANGMVPGMTGTGFGIEELSINPFTGRVFLRECHLKNPEGYRSEEAFGVSTAIVDVAVCSLFSDEIHVELISISGLQASYLSDTKGINNFDRIIAHASGKEPGAKPTEEELAAKKAEEEAAKEAKKAAEARGETGPKVVIDHFELKDSSVSYGIIRGTPPITLPLPSVVLDDIGKDKKGGMTFAEAGNAIWQACLQVGGKAGESIKKLGGLAADGAAAVGEAAGAAVGAIGDAAGATAGAIGDAAGATAGAIGDAAGAAADAVGGAVKSVGNLFKGGK